MALEDDITTLTALVQRMVNESGETTGFDARSWLEHWLTGVVPHWVIGGLLMCSMSPMV